MMDKSRMTVLRRLTIGFVALFVTATSVSVYAIIKLNQFNRASTYMLEIGDRMTQYEEKLTDTLFSQVLYERKYVISKDDTLYSHFVSAGKDFAGGLDEAISIADTLGTKDILANIKEQHTRYRVLFENEVKLIKSNQVYRSGWYKKEKERAVDSMIEDLNNLELFIESDIKDRIKGLVDAGTRALRVAVAMAFFSLLFGILIAVGITRSITKPLFIMKKKTQEIARGDFEPTLNISSPPEIAELAGAFNLMCRRLSELDAMKSDFFSLMAHELRTPLSSIKAGISLLMKNSDRWDAGKRDRVLTIVSEECIRLIGLVNSLLDFSKMEAGMISFNLASGDIESLIGKAIAEIEPLSTTKRIIIEFDGTGETPAVMMDTERILQVLRNLLGNALKFTPEGGRIKVSSRPVPGGLEVSVTDSGQGISEEDRTMIFVKYKQASADIPAKTTGTGLGLAIAKHIVDAHGGRIWVESQIERGSTFSFFLPA
jgi:two-component system, NtrC family, sensor histidine kinase GlrK